MLLDDRSFTVLVRICTALSKATNEKESVSNEQDAPSNNVPHTQPVAVHCIPPVHGSGHLAALLSCNRTFLVRKMNLASDRGAQFLADLQMLVYSSVTTDII
jgi:hypothetical protein